MVEVVADDRIVEIVERLARIETMLQSDIKALSDRVNKLESSNTWLSRTVIGIVISGVMALVIVGGKI